MCRAVDSRGQTIDFLLSARRDAEAAKRFFRKALGQPHTVNPRTISVDKNAAYPKAAAEMKRNGELWRRSRLRQVKHVNNAAEAAVSRWKRVIGDGLRAHTDERRATEVDVAVHALSRMLELGRPNYVRIA